MTLKQIIGTIKKLATKHPNVNSTYEGNIYDILNANPSNKYASVVLTQTTHTQDEMFDHYGFVIFYVDRLIDDVEDNRVQIQSIGKSMLTNIVEAFCYEFDAEHNDITFHPFTQKFADETAGVYIDIVIDTPKDSICAERYWDEQWSAPIITIKNATEQIHITDNGRFEVTYDPTNYTGLEKVIIDVEIDTFPYYNEGFSNGHEIGFDEGYNSGFDIGIEEQKNKLESITITENGAYQREDGFSEIIVDVPDTNGSYDEGYNDGYTNGDGDGYNRGYAEGEANGVENAGEIIAQTAQVLNITENGNYLTQYSDPFMPEGDVTGYFDDGTEFKSYAYLKQQVFDTGIAATKDTRLEFWYKGDNTLVGDAFNVIIGAGKYDDGSKYEIRYYFYSNSEIQFTVGPLEGLFYTWDENAWHHILIAKETEDASFMSLWIDEVKIGDFGNTPFNPQSTFYINGIEYDLGGQRRANGCFGMIKIDDTIIIPTEEGYLNTNTGTLLEVVEEGVYVFTDNTPQVPEGNLIKTINVNVLPKINPNDYNLKFGQSTFVSLPEWVEWEKITEYGYLFYNCQQLKDISLIKKINGTSLDSTFQNCKSIKGDNIKHLDISNVTNMRYTFYLTDLDYFPSLDTSNVTDFSYCFADCNQLKYVEPIDTSKARTFNQMFYSFSSVKALERLPEFDCTNVTSISQYFCYDGYKDKMDKLTDVGGWKNLKIDWTSYGLNCCRNLSYQSCINVLNGLYDFRGNGDETTTRTLKVHQNFIDLVGDEISIGTQKGWLITA